MKKIFKGKLQEKSMFNFTTELGIDYFKRIIKRVIFIAICIVLLPIVSLILSFNETIKALGLFILFLIIIENGVRIFARTFIYIYSKANDLPLDSEDLFILGVRNISDVIKVIIAFFVGLYLFGVNIAEFFTTISIVAVAIVWGLKEFILNFLAGMHLLFSRFVEIKEYVEIKGIRGRITDITSQNIEMKTDNGDMVYIPNSTIMSEEVISSSKENLKKIRIEISLLRDEMPLIKKIEKQLYKKLMEEHEDLLIKENPIILQYQEILSKKVSFLFIVQISRYSFEAENTIRQIALSIIGDLLIKYHNNEKSHKIGNQ